MLCHYFAKYVITSAIAIDFLSQHPSPNHGLWKSKRVSTWWRGPARLTEKVGCRKESSCMLMLPGILLE